MNTGFTPFTVTFVNEPTVDKDHDHLLQTDDCIVVVDGATPLQGLGTADGDSVRSLCTCVADAIASSPINDPVDRFIDAASRCNTDDGSSAVAAAIWTHGGMVIGAAVGDCVVAIETIDGSVTVLLDQVLGDLDAAAVERMHEKNGTPRREDAADLLLANRMLVNTSDGYGAFGPSGMQPAHVKHAAVPLSSVKRILVCSDGFWRALDTYGLVHDVRELIASASKSLPGLVRSIRRTESSDLSGDLFPRISPSDDITAVLLDSF